MIIENNKNSCLAVFSSSKLGDNPAYVLGAQEIGQQLAISRLGLICGNGSCGLMKIIVDSVVNYNGHVTCVVVESETGHLKASSTINASSIAERKKLMFEMSSGFIVLPGGVGTIDEFFSIYALTKLGIENKPIGLLNIDGFFDDIINFLDKLISNQFMKKSDKDKIIVENEVNLLMNKMLDKI